MYVYTHSHSSPDCTLGRPKCALRENSLPPYIHNIAHRKYMTNRSFMLLLMQEEVTHWKCLDVPYKCILLRMVPSIPLIAL